MIRILLFSIQEEEIIHHFELLIHLHEQDQQQIDRLFLTHQSRLIDLIPFSVFSLLQMILCEMKVISQTMSFFYIHCTTTTKFKMVQKPRLCILCFQRRHSLSYQHEYVVVFLLIIYHYSFVFGCSILWSPKIHYQIACMMNGTIAKTPSKIQPRRKGSSSHCSCGIGHGLMNHCTATWMNIKEAH